MGRGDFQEKKKDRDDQGENGGRFGHGLAHEHVLEDVAGKLGAAGDRQVGLGGGVAFADGRAECPEAHGDPGTGKGGRRYECLRVDWHGSFHLH